MTMLLAEHDLDRRASRKQERSALRWYGTLDHRPISKPSTALTRQQSQKREHARLSAAFSAYADLDGPKH